MYYPTKESVAYDYSRFDRRQRVKTAVEGEQARSPKTVRRTAKRHPFPVFEMLVFLGVVVVCMGIISSFMKVTVLSDQESTLKKELAELTGEQTALRAQQEKLFNLAMIEERAQTDLQMFQFDRSQTEYVSLTNDDEIVVNRDTDSKSVVLTGIVKSFNVVMEYLS